MTCRNWTMSVMNNQCLYVNIFSVEICGKSLGGVIHQVFGNLVGLLNIKIPTRPSGHQN